MQGTHDARENQVSIDGNYESMCRAIDAKGSEWLAKFGITPESWKDWRSGKKVASTEGLQWETPGDPTRFELHYPLHAAPRKTQQWDNWAAAMMMDTRLSPGAKAVLTRLALHYNLNSGDCFPAHGRLAAETMVSNEMVRSTLRKAAKLGWIRRTCRTGGPHGKNQTNLYDLTLPTSICEVLAEINYRPSGPILQGYRYPTTRPPRPLQTGGRPVQIEGATGTYITP
jgi:hypothetical protein